MKCITISVLVAAAVVSAGCDGAYRAQERRNRVNERLVMWYGDEAINNAIISQRTLYPYHFVNGAAALNDLGARDLAVLAKHLAEHPGTLNIRKQGTESHLYQARVDTVRQRLVEQGVEADRISLSDGLAGGDGMATEQVLVIVHADQEGRASTATHRAKTTGSGTP